MSFKVFSLNNYLKKALFISAITLICAPNANAGVAITSPDSTTAAKHSVARKWNEVLLEAIRKDFARPTVHARNLFHTSIIMYDAWAAYQTEAKTYFLGNAFGTFGVPFKSAIVRSLADSVRSTAVDEALSYGTYRLLKHRFAKSPGASITLPLMDSLFISLGYDSSYTSSDYYGTGKPAALGNYLAEQMILFGYQDGSNEQGGYGNLYYYPGNLPLVPSLPGNPRLSDPNRWQPLTLALNIDQSGQKVAKPTLDFLSPEWGNVIPFSLKDSNKTTFERDFANYTVYHDPGNPPYLDEEDAYSTNSLYQWNFSLVSIWSSHLDTKDSVMWDISPANIGNIVFDSLPKTLEGHREFYKKLEGGDISPGHAVNPKTGQPYAPQIVPRGDYTRILAEFWADGPDSETPPGHWFTILNYVSDHPQFAKKWAGTDTITSIEWDVKAYFTLGGAMHDAAIAAWSIKGKHDYIRPISAIRYMADLGQSSDTTLSNYHPLGIPLDSGLIEVVKSDDPLAASDSTHIGKIKVMAWKGHDYISNAKEEVAGVDWILAENWWPYQRPSFVTPPFAGYVSGHSTYSRAAAEVMTLMTGDAFFPGGMGEFHAPQNNFLVFEMGPSVDVTLQWATYRDASDQCSLSRIWGGIHPPADDIPGRLIGAKIGVRAYNLAQQFFSGGTTAPEVRTSIIPQIYKDKIIDRIDGEADILNINLFKKYKHIKAALYDVSGKHLMSKSINNANTIDMDMANLKNGVYFIQLNLDHETTSVKFSKQNK